MEFSKNLKIPYVAEEKGQIKAKYGAQGQIIYLRPVIFQKGQIKAKFSKKAKQIFRGQAVFKKAKFLEFGPKKGQLPTLLKTLG